MKYSKYTIRLREGFKRILIAVDKPVAAHAADIGMELSRELKAEMALVYVINGTVDYMGHAGISSEQLIALAEQEGKQAPSDFSQRLVPKSGALKFLQRGAPGTEMSGRHGNSPLTSSS